LENSLNVSPCESTVPTGTVSLGPNCCKDCVQGLPQTRTSAPPLSCVNATYMAFASPRPASPNASIRGPTSSSFLTYSSYSLSIRCRGPTRQRPLHLLQVLPTNVFNKLVGKRHSAAILDCGPLPACSSCRVLLDRAGRAEENVAGALKVQRRMICCQMITERDSFESLWWLIFLRLHYCRRREFDKSRLYLQYCGDW
jgi:hypothetical protein